ncbi:MAG TPA: hypothetical protein PKG52_11050, partial [bacterium]|nr:hypothetical protein [bacterium]
MKKRNEIDAKFMWKPEHIYDSEEAVQEDFLIVGTAADEMPRFKGHLNDRDSLLAALKMSTDAMRRIMKLESYASRNKDVDMTVGKWQELAGMVVS